MQKRLYRSRKERMLWGVCGGIAEYAGIDPTLVRVILVLLALLSGGGLILAYIILAIVIPLESSQAQQPRDVIRENVEEIKQSAGQFAQNVQSTFSQNQPHVTPSGQGGMSRGVFLLALVLIVIGILVLIANLNPFWWFRWHYLWPVVLIGLGVWIILAHRRR